MPRLGSRVRISFLAHQKPPISGGFFRSRGKGFRGSETWEVWLVKQRLTLINLIQTMNGTQVVGSQAVSTFWTGAPDCGQNASITVTKDMGGSKIYPATYEVVDDAGYTVWSGIVNFEANTCTAYDLTL